MESREEEQEEETSGTFAADETTVTLETTNSMTADAAATTTTAAAFTSTAMTTLPTPSDDQIEDEEVKGDSIVMATRDASIVGETEEGRGCREQAFSTNEEDEEEDEQGAVGSEESESEQNPSIPSGDRPAPPSSLALSGARPMKKKVLVAPTLSLSLGGSGSMVSDDFPSAFISPSPENDDDPALDFDLDAIETPSDSESLHLPTYDLDLEDDLRRLGVASRRVRAHSSRSRSDSRTDSLRGIDHSGLGALERDDVVDSEGTRWRSFSTGEPPQESRVNMSVLEPFLRVLSHGGYYGDSMNDIIVFSSCYLPENSVENYQYVMDNLFRFVVGTLELMVAENYVIVYLCAGGQKDKVPGISWLKECYTTIDRKLRKNLKGFYVVHPTWYIKALITIIKPFISTKFSRKIQFIDSLQELSNCIPTEHVQIPESVKEYDQSLSR